ncbi:MAG: 3-hydroxyacyl-CoA dehydrogenase NAD-binding domain-containing protein [Pseudomonadota bacterium]
MTYKNFTIETDADGIALITWDSPGKSMNVINASVMDELDALFTAVEDDEAIKGAVLTSGKDAFGAGADLTMLQTMLGQFKAQEAENKEAAIQALFDGAFRLNTSLRRMETGSKPWVAALNGVALGGCFEIALACHARVASDNPKLRVGLPEVKVGLLPGGGGTQRVPRLVNTQDALQMLLQGKAHPGAKAKQLGLVNDVVPAAELIEKAKGLIKDGLKPQQPWDVKGFKLPGGPVYSAAGAQLFPAANAHYRKETFDNYPGARAIMKCVYEGLIVPFDTALKIESRYFAHVLQTTEAASMIRSLFMSMQELNKGARRPADVPANEIKKVGVLGAGFMGAGIAYVTAKAGIEVVLIDQSQEAADKGKSYSADLMDKAISRRRATAEDKEALLSKITATTDYDTLSDADLIVEAVFEDADVKAKVTAQAEAAMPEASIYASNTSTIPITSLAKASKRPEQFIGIHFFSPVDKMLLVEIIMGEETGDKALAMAVDYVLKIKKTPIVVNDSRGFFANRCVFRYMNEAYNMLLEGVPPAMIENAARMAGMPVGPLALNDEVAIDLSLKVMRQTAKDLGEQAVDPRYLELTETMVEKQGRLGRKNGKGFYEYPAKPAKKHLWPDLGEHFPQKPADEFDVQDLKDRFLYTMAIEAARTVEEGVVTDIREADVGAIIGFGFAPYTGGPISMIDGIGLPEFVARAKELAEQFGSHFEPTPLLVDLGSKDESFYQRYRPQEAQAA